MLLEKASAPYKRTPVNSSTLEQCHLKLSAEYCCEPFWIVEPGGGSDAPLVSSLGLPDELEKRLDAWNEIFQATYDPAYPPDGGLREDQVEGFNNEGRALAQMLANWYKMPIEFAYYGGPREKFFPNEGI